MKPDVAETTTADNTLEERLQALEQALAAMSANVGEAMEAVGAAFRAMGGPGGFTTYALRVVDSEGRLVATLAPGADAVGELVLYDGATGAKLNLRP